MGGRNWPDLLPRRSADSSGRTARVVTGQARLAPMPLETYEQVRPYAAAIREQYARYGRCLLGLPIRVAGNFLTILTLALSEIADHRNLGGCQCAGRRSSGCPGRVAVDAGWNIESPDAVLHDANARSRFPAAGDVPYQYIIIPTHFKEDRWVQDVGDSAEQSHGGASCGGLYSRPGQHGCEARRWVCHLAPMICQRRNCAAMRCGPTSDILLVYAPGSSPDRMAGRICEVRSRRIGYCPADALHDSRHATEDQTSDRAGVCESSRRGNGC